jgi:lysophospholipase L1-like esterase
MGISIAVSRARGHGPAGRPGLVAAAMAAVMVALAGCQAGGGGHAASSPVRGASRSPSRTAPSAAPRPSPAATAGTLRPLTSCRSVVHIGDSTSDGLVLPAYQPRARLRIAAQYRRVGVAHFIPEVSGARSIVETWHGFPNGQTVARGLIRGGYHGCWVIALGTNDAADVAVGSAVGLAARIRLMMSLIGSQPVLWVNVITLVSGGPYAEYHMRQWNRALLQACPRYPNMRVYDWAAAAKPGWFISDGIHYTPRGYAHRARLIAHALATAFPAPPPSAPGSAQPSAPPSASPQPSPGSTGAAAAHDGCLVR